MRDFTSVVDFHAMVSEIYRDLSKAPILQSTRVQNKAKIQSVKEALNYNYMVDASSLLNEGILSIFNTMAEFSNFYGTQDPAVLDSWTRAELYDRITGSSPGPMKIPHPELAQYREGSEFSYLYGDRLHWQWDSVVETLVRNPDSRRAYMSVWRADDLARAKRYTRIPCSLGYHFLIRQTDSGPKLHMTYFQRSCDFEIFWVTDLWLAIKAMEHVLGCLKLQMHVESLGILTHNIVSFHQFFDPEEEIY